MRDRDDLPYIVIERRTGGMGSFIYGAVLGAGLALLFAPRSGRETRAEIRTGVQRMRDRAEDAVRQVQESVTGTIEDVREEVNDRIDAAREAFEAGRQAARETREQMERRVQQARAGVRAGLQTARTDSPQPRVASELGADEDTAFGV